MTLFFFIVAANLNNIEFLAPNDIVSEKHVFAIVAT